MAELVTKGFIGGHAATKGFYSEAARAIDALMSELEQHQGVTPLVRLRFDLDGDGVYETIEQGEIASVGNINRVLEYLTNKPRFGSCSFTLRNNDLRWSDFNPKSYTYCVGANPKRYMFRKCIVELGFDNFAKKNNDGWFPLFFGYINVKQENASGRTVDITLLDEWSRIFNAPLYTTVPGHDYFDYVNTAFEDYREIGCGTYYGKHHFLAANYLDKDKQLMIPLAYNIAIEDALNNFAAYRLLSFACIDFNNLIGNVYINRFAGSLAQSSDVVNYNQIYVWGWNKDWFSNGKAQWLRIPVYDTKDGSTVWQIIFENNQNCYLQGYGSNVGLIGYDVAGVKHDLAWSQLLDTTNEDFEWKCSAHCELESNPAKILYQLLNGYLALPPADIDASSSTIANWEYQELDYDNPLYYSFDTSAYYLDLQSCKVCVNIDKETTFQELLESICEMTRGSVFIDKGKDIVNDRPIRRIHYVIHQPRLLPLKYKTINEDRLFNPTLYKDVTDIKNSISVASFDYGATKTIESLTIQSVSDSGSIGVYGTREYSIKRTASDISFLYDSALYALFLAQHYLILFKEPPIKLDFRTNLVGYNWDLKSLIGIKERTSLGLDASPENAIATGVFEVYGFNFDTRAFNVALSCKWAGYLLAPDGDVNNKRWAYIDNSYCNDTDTPLTYHCW